MLVVRRLRARLITAIQKGIKLQCSTGNAFGRSLANIRYAAGHVERNPQWLEIVCWPLRTTGPSLRAQRADWISPVMGRQILNLPSPSAAAPNTCPFLDRHFGRSASFVCLDRRKNKWVALHR